MATKRQTTSFFAAMAGQLSGAAGSPASKSSAKSRGRKPDMKHPRRLRRGVIEALSSVELHLALYRIKDDVAAVMAEYRANRQGGILNPHYVIHRRECLGLVDAIAKLDTAYYALHNYDPEDDDSEGQYRLQQGKNGRFDRRKEIKKYLAGEGVLTKIGTDKKSIIDRAAEKFVVGRRSIYRAIEALKSVS